MADTVDRLIVGSEFDASGLTRGLDIGTAALADFEKAVRAVAKQVPDLNFQRLNETAAQVKRAAAETAALNAKVAEASRMVTTFGGATSDVGVKLKDAHRATNLMRTGLVQLAAQSLGTTSSLGNLAQSALFFAGGSTAVIAGAAAVLGLVKAWELFTAGQRDAARAMEESRDRLKKLQEQQAGPIAQATEEFGRWRGEVNRLNKGLADLGEQQARVAEAIAGVGPQEASALLTLQTGLMGKQVRLSRELSEALGLQRTAQVALNEANKESTARGDELVRSLALQAATFGKTALEAQRVATAMDATLTPGQRAAATATLDFLIRLERQTKAHDAAAEAAKRQAQALAQLMKQHQRPSGNLTQGAGGAVLLPVIDVPEILKGARALGNVTNALGHAAEGAERLAREFTDIGTVAFGLAEVARSIESISDQAITAIEGVGRLADALSQVALNASFGNIVGAIAAGGSFIGGLFAGGESAEQREQREAIRQLTQGLEDLRVSMDRNVETLVGFQLSLATIGKLQGALPTSLRGPFTIGIEEQEAFRRTLTEAGLTLEQFAAIIRRQTGGLEILDRQGRLTAEGLKIAEEGLKLVAAEAERIAKEETTRKAAEEVAEAFRKAQTAASDLADALREQVRLEREINQANRELERQHMDIISRLLGEPQDAAAQFQRELDLLAQSIPGLGDLFAGLDLADPATAQALREKLFGVLKQLDLGEIDAGLRDEVMRLLGIGADVLGSFNKSVQDATKSLINVPQGLNLMALEFQAQAAGSGTRGGDVLFTQAPGRSGGTTINWQGDIIIEGANRPPEEIAREVDKVLSRRQNARTGSPDWNRMA